MLLHPPEVTVEVVLLECEGFDFPRPKEERKGGGKNNNFMLDLFLIISKFSCLI